MNNTDFKKILTLANRAKGEKNSHMPLLEHVRFSIDPNEGTVLIESTNRYIAFRAKFEVPIHGIDEPLELLLNDDEMKTLIKNAGHFLNIVQGDGHTIVNNVFVTEKDLGQWPNIGRLFRDLEIDHTVKDIGYMAFNGASGLHKLTAKAVIGDKPWQIFYQTNGHNKPMLWVPPVPHCAVLVMPLPMDTNSRERAELWESVRAIL